MFIEFASFLGWQSTDKIRKVVLLFKGNNEQASVNFSPACR